jgi:hypothetical protein
MLVQESTVEAFDATTSSESSDSVDPKTENTGEKWCSLILAMCKNGLER